MQIIGNSLKRDGFFKKDWKLNVVLHPIIRKSGKECEMTSWRIVPLAVALFLVGCASYRPDPPIPPNKIKQQMLDDLSDVHLLIKYGSSPEFVGL